MQPEYETLNALRIDRDWTWDDLAQQMAKIHLKISARTLHYLLTRQDTNPRDRTIHKIRKYLAHARKHRMLPKAEGVAS